MLVKLQGLSTASSGWIKKWRASFWENTETGKDIYQRPKAGSVGFGYSGQVERLVRLTVAYKTSVDPPHRSEEDSDYKEGEIRIDVPVAEEFRVSVKDLLNTDRFVDEGKHPFFMKTTGTADHNYSTGFGSTLGFRNTNNSRKIKHNTTMLSEKSNNSKNIRSRTVEAANKSEFNTTNASTHMNSQMDELLGTGFIDLAKFKAKNKSVAHENEPEMEQALSLIQNPREVVASQKRGKPQKNFIRLNRTTTRIKPPIQM